MVRTAPFFAVALVIALAFGGVLGSVVLASRHLPWPALSGPALQAARSVHGHAQVFGFATLFIMGVAYHALPRLSGVPLRMPRLARSTLYLQVGGVVSCGLSALGGAWHAGLAVAAALALSTGALAFACVVEDAIGTLPAGSPAPWLRAGSWWLVVAVMLDVGAAAGRCELQPAVWDAALYGFVSAWVFGMSMQFLPMLLARAPCSIPTPVFLAYQAAVGGLVSASALVPVLHPLRIVAAASLVAATLAVVADLNVLGAPNQRYDAASADGGASAFVRTAYAWLAVSLVCGPGWQAVAGLRGVAPPLLLTDFARHAFTLGFLTQMIVGVTSRLVPAFSGRELWHPRLRVAVFWLLNAGIAVRGLQAWVEGGGPWTLWPWVAVSAPLVLGALGIFTAAVVRTARPPRAA